MFITAFIDDLMKGLGFDWDCKKKRVRCNGHIINLSVLGFLSGCTTSKKQRSS
jgi:hypothetical protein